MNSAVFNPSAAASTASTAAEPPRLAAAAPAAPRAAASSPARAPRPPIDWRGVWLAVLPPLLGIGLLVGIWAVATAGSSIDCDMPAANPSAIIGGSAPDPKPSPAGASAAPAGRWASRRACMNAAIAAEPTTDPIVRVVL